MALALSFVPFAVRADEKMALLQADGRTYSNVVITTVSATDIYFTHSGGMGTVKLESLPPDLQKHFNYDPDKAKAAQPQQADDAQKYQDQLLQQFSVQPPGTMRDAAAAPTQAPVTPPGLTALLTQAQADDKMVLLDFTGSDWSEWCNKFDDEVLSTDKFSTYAGQKLKLLKVDFLHHTTQPEDLRAANIALANQFKVRAFPTFVLLDSSGKELGRQVGYQAGGADAFITELEGFSGR